MNLRADEGGIVIEKTFTRRSSRFRPCFRAGSFPVTPFILRHRTLTNPPLRSLINGKRVLFRSFLAGDIYKCPSRLTVRDTAPKLDGIDIFIFTGEGKMITDEVGRHSENLLLST